VLQLRRTEGNVVINCKNGRTRSPMYLVAYLMLCYDMEVEDARSIIGKQLRAERNLELDRDNRLLPVVESLI